jgi:tetratricopeptide (TPR) repeat protein
MKFLQAVMYVCLCAGPACARNFLVLPFFNNGKSDNLDWVGDSISEAIRDALASEGVLTLERDARDEAFRRLSIKPYFPLTKASVIRLAETVDADQVIFGSFEVLPAEGLPEGQEAWRRGTLRVNAQALDLRKARTGPEYSAGGPLQDLARLQTNLSWRILQFVLPAGSPSEEEFRKRQPTARVDAIESYIRGLLSASPDQSLKYFAQAAHLDPNYSHANFELGRMLFDRKMHRKAADYLAKVSDVHSHYREAQFLLGLCHYQLSDFAAAEQAFQTVAKQVPLNEVLNNLGAAQSRLNRPEALENLKKALEGDSTDPDYHFNVGYALMQQGDFKSAADRFRAVLDRDADDVEATTMLGRCLKVPPPQAPARSGGLERLKENYEESAYWQLKAILESKR